MQFGRLLTCQKFDVNEFEVVFKLKFVGVKTPPRFCFVLFARDFGFGHNNLVPKSGIKII